MNKFDPTLVPRGTLKTMAKRMHNHPKLDDLGLSKCQEILAKTFGHDSWHALSKPKPSRAGQAAGSIRDRVLIYELLIMCLESKLDAVTAMDWIGVVAAKGVNIPLRDLTGKIIQSMKQGKSLGQAFHENFEGHGRAEVFVVQQSEISGTILYGLREACNFARQEENITDHAEKLGQGVLS